MPYINHYCYRSPIRTFLTLTKEEWLAQMMDRHFQTTNHPLKSASVRAWANCFDVLHTTFSELPEKYHKLQVVFEYVLPIFPPDTPCDRDDPGVRADVLIVGKRDIVVLEFKQLKESNIYAERQARKYQRRIQNWHVQSKGMNKKTILVLTHASGVNNHIYKLNICSPDQLAVVLQKLLGPDPRKMPRKMMREWLHSEYKKAPTAAGSGSQTKQDFPREQEPAYVSCLEALAEGYQTGYFDAIYPMLSETCKWESQWRLDPVVGREAVIQYYEDKGDAIRCSDSFSECLVVRLVGNMNLHTAKGVTSGIWYDSGKPCLYMEQTIDGETNGMMVDITMDDSGKLSKINICMPGFYRCIPYEE